MRLPSPPGPLRSLLREAAGVDLCDACLHTGRHAIVAAALLRVDAFVIARHVFLSARAAESLARRTPAGLTLLAHELAHVAQYRRHGVRRFLQRYLADYLTARLRGRNHADAYTAIPFEREARESEEAFRNALTLRAETLEVTWEGSPADRPHDA